MSPHPTTLLGLVFSLAQTIHMHDGSLPVPSIRAEPGSVILRGRTVTFVCGSPAGADVFLLYEKGKGSSQWNHKTMSQHGSQGAEGRFRIPAVSNDTEGCYYCHYGKGDRWSERSELLELKVIDEDISMPPSGLSTVHVNILVGTSVAFSLCLFLLVLLLVHRQHQKKHRSPQSKGEEQRPQERLSLAEDVIESTPDAATSDALLVNNRERHSPSPAAGDPQEVTYAQLDQWALTMRAARSVSPPSTEPTAISSTYAVLARH